MLLRTGLTSSPPGTFLAPVGIGLALFIAQLFSTPYTGSALNPARALGPDVVLASFPGYAWIWYTAPFVGSLVASGLYGVMRAAKFHTAVAGQDDDAVAMIMRDKQGEMIGFVSLHSREQQFLISVLTALAMHRWTKFANPTHRRSCRMQPMSRSRSTPRSVRPS